MSCTVIWSKSRLHDTLLPIWSKSRLQKKIKWLSGQNPGFPLILGPTNIQLNPGFKVIGRVNCYLVKIQASQCTSLLYGKNPGFTILYCYLVKIQASRYLTSYLVNIQASEGNQMVTWLNPGFKVIG